MMSHVLRAGRAHFALILLLAACGGGDDDAPATDAGIDEVNAEVVQGADAATCTTSLDPVDDGTGLVTDLIISEINPGDYIEVFNPGDEDVNISTTDFQWCSPFEYSALPPTVTVPAGGYALVEWPVNFTNSTEAGGQVILFRNGIFDVDQHIIDFVCWGTSDEGRKTQAETVGKWIGDCAPALPAGGAIHREPATMGTGAADYDTTAAPSPTNCTP